MLPSTVPSHEVWKTRNKFVFQLCESDLIGTMIAVILSVEESHIGLPLYPAGAWLTASSRGSRGVVIRPEGGFRLQPWKLRPLGMACCWHFGLAHLLFFASLVVNLLFVPISTWNLFLIWPLNLSWKTFFVQFLYFYFLLLFLFPLFARPISKPRVL